MWDEKTRGIRESFVGWVEHVSVCIRRRESACVYTVTSPSRWLQLFLGSWDTDESFSQIRLHHPQTALKLQFIPALTMELTGEGQGHCNRLTSFSSFKMQYTQTHGCSRLVALPPSVTSSSSRSLIPQIIIPCLTSHAVLSLEQTAHPHRHGNSGTTACSLALLGVGHLNLSLSLSFSFSHAVIHVHPLSAHRSPLETLPVCTHRIPPITTTPQ